jgi:hypothetical protein
MPISRSFFRTDGQSNAPRLTSNTFVPFYSVLFWYDNDANFVNTASGTLDRDYYRSYSELYYPTALYYFTDGTFDSLRSCPVIACVNADANWKTTTGICYVPTTSLPNTGATLFQTHTHNPTTLGRTVVYNALGSYSGDPLSTTEFYYEQRGDHTHFHTTNNIAQGLRAIQYGVKDGNGNYQGLNAIAVKPILRDPQLSTIVTGYTDARLSYFPKGVIVFGNSLPSQHYSRNDNLHSSTANGNVLPLVASGENLGVIGIANTLSFTIPSSSSPLHNHTDFPPLRQNKSDKVNQTGYRIVEAGVHTHNTTYTANVAIRSKILRAWITTSEQTPISNGVIIGYSIGATSLFQGQESNSISLPVNWHFCDGNNGTPDLRGYYIYANFDTANTYHDVVFNPSNTYLITSLSMSANGKHSHLGPLTGTEIGVGYATDIGSHTMEDVLDHTHVVSNTTSFKYTPSDTSNATNILVGQSYSYTPPTLNLAFIMYNENII